MVLGDIRYIHINPNQMTPNAHHIRFDLRNLSIDVRQRHQ